MSSLWPSILVTDAQGPHAPKAYLTALPSDTEADPLSPVLLNGDKAGSGAVPEFPHAIVGNIWPAVNDTFYNRILIEPALLEMGNLLSNQTRTITVWNGFLSNETLESFSAANAVGIQITQPVTPPYEMRPLEQLNYVLNITTDGPAVIDATLTWVVEGESYTAGVTGRRVVVWPFGPSWDTPVVESLAWLTDVIKSFDGTEQRRALRTKARRSFTYTFKTFREDSARMDNLLWGWQNRLYALPVWTDKSELTQEAAATTFLLRADTSTYSFIAGGLAVLYRDSVDMEIVEIESVAAGAINLLRPLERTWAKGTTVMPVILGYLPSAVAMLRYTSQAVVGSLTFTSNPGDTDPYTPVAVAPTIYDGLEVITRQPNWATPLDITSQYMFETLDKATGVISWDQTEEWPQIVRKYSWLLNGRQQIKDFRSMLGRRIGRLKPLYVPTWHDDFVVTREMGAADTGLYVKDNEFRLMVGVDPARDRLMIRLKNGNVYYRKIVGVSSDGTNTILTLDQSLGVAVPLAQFKAVHSLMRSRLAVDQVDITWRNTNVGVVETNFITIKE